MTAGDTAIYCRISQDSQAGAGVERQAKECRSLVKRLGWEPVARVFTDNDISAYNGKPRPAYDEMLAAVKAGAITRVAVWDLDRLYRRPVELEQLIDLADQGKVQVATVNTGDLNIGTDDGVTMMRITVAIANQASRKTSKRVKAAKAQAREKGLPMGGPRAFGWRSIPMVKDGQLVLNQRGLPRKAYEPDPKEAELIRGAVDSLLGGASLNDIARRWNSTGAGQPHTGKADWHADIIRQVVSNPRHAGLVGRRELLRQDGVQPRFARPVVVGEGTWPAIVDREKWERLQALLDHRGAAGRIPRRRSLLTGLVLCGSCGYVMSRTGAHGHDGSGEVRRVFRCPTTLKVKNDAGETVEEKQRGCGRISIDAAGLESLLTEATLERADTVSLAKMVKQQGSEGKEAAAIVKKLDELARREDQAGVSYAKGRLPLRPFETMTAAIVRERDDLQRRLGRITSTSAIAPFAGKAGVLRKQWPTLSLDQKRAIIGTVLGQVKVLPTLRPGRPRFDAHRVQIVAARKSARGL